ncbi:MAG TPA: hypothetical protein VMS84_17085 [Mycobacterium sp.]|nr:hypothetical protein [Mycobacterium sp.]
MTGRPATQRGPGPVALGLIDDQGAGHGLGGMVGAWMVAMDGRRRRVAHTVG